MPAIQAGVDEFINAKVIYAPSKASNGDGVAVSGLKMTKQYAVIIDSGSVRWSPTDNYGRYSCSIRSL